MGKAFNRSLPLVILVIAVATVSLFLLKQTAIAGVNESAITDQLDTSSQIKEVEQPTEESTVAIETKYDSNPTVSAAIERAMEDPEFWDIEAGQDDSVRFLAVGGGFLQGAMEDEENGILLDSDTNPNAATLGEIREALREHGLAP